MTTLRTRRTLAATALVAALPFALTACAEAAEKAAEEAAEQAIEENGGGDVDIDVDDGEVKVENSDGSVVIGGGDLPEDFPKDAVPVVGEVQYANSTTTPDGRGWTVSTTAGGSPEDALAEARSALEDAGFSEQGGGLGGAHVAMQSDEYAVVLTAADTGSGGTGLVYVVTTHRSE
ncbi:MAG TPA: hypothetical protein VNT31_16295 [Nocardioides sp.]|nr:hypothetical protein [Nocardioides sp.]